MVDDLKKWDIRTSNLSRIGSVELAAQVWFTMHADWQHVTWAFSHWDFALGKKNTFQRKIELVARMIIASIECSVNGTGVRCKGDGDSESRGCG